MNENDKPGQNKTLDRAVERLRRSGMSRRQALKAIVASGLGITVSPLVSRLAWGATSPSGLPLARPNKPVTLPMNGSAIADGLKPESGTFKIFNYADYVYKGLLDKFGEQYDVDVQVTTFDNMDQAVTKLANNDVDVDVTELTPDRLTQVNAGKLLQPINKNYIPNLEKNVWPQLHSPFYDRGSRYTVPYTVYGSGIAWRGDKVTEDIANMDNPWSIYWNAEAYEGYVGLLNSPRELLGLALLYRGHSDINTEDPETIDQALDDLKAMVPVCNPRVTNTQYQSLAQGRSWLDQAWGGSALMNAWWYLPEGQSTETIQFWTGTRGEAPIQNDVWAIPTASTKPVLAHLWMNFILDEQNAHSNFVNFTGYQPPINSIVADRLIAEGTVPKHLHAAVVDPSAFGSDSLQYMTLTPEGQRMWQDAYAQFLSGT